MGNGNGTLEKHVSEWKETAFFELGALAKQLVEKQTQFPTGSHFYKEVSELLQAARQLSEDVREEKIDDNSYLLRYEIIVERLEEIKAGETGVMTKESLLVTSRESQKISEQEVPANALCATLRDPVVIVETLITKKVVDELYDPLVRLEDVRPWKWRLVETLAKPKNQQRISAAILIAIGFVIRALINASSWSGTSTGVPVFGKFFMWTFIALAALIGLGVGLVVSHRRQQYTLKKIILLAPFIGALGGFFLFEELWIKAICGFVAISIFGFWTAGPVYTKIRSAGEKLKGKKMPVNTLVKGLGAIALFGLVAGLAFLVHRGDIQIPSFDEKMLSLVATGIVTTLATLWALRSKRKSVLIVGSLTSTLSVLGLVYGSLYLFDWEWFWSSQNALMTAGIAGAVVIAGFLLWFFLKKPQPSNQQVQPSQIPVFEKGKSLGWNLVLIVAGFLIAHFVFGNQTLPTLVSKPTFVSELGEKTIFLQPGESFEQDLPTEGYRIEYEISSGGWIEEVTNKEGKPFKWDTSNGKRFWEKGVFHIKLTNTSPSETVLKKKFEKLKTE
ncbi:MAG: hypothetical protein RJA61_722 [Candidatus Parcubacteria bacterium]|jgi:hypothetical protein